MINSLPMSISEAKNLAQWIAEQQACLEVDASDGVRLPAALFGVSIEHHSGITCLVDQKIYPPACSLLRPQYEGLIRGMWLMRCARPDQIEKFSREDRFPYGTPRLIYDIEENIKTIRSKNTLLDFHKRIWNMLNSYTHIGTYQLSRYLDSESIGSSISDNELIDLLHGSGWIALLALHEIAVLAGNKKLAKATVEKAVILLSHNSGSSKLASP